MTFTRKLQIILTILISEIESVSSPSYKWSFKFLQLVRYVRKFLVYVICLSQIGCNFPYYTCTTTSFSTRSPSCISLDFTLELYLLATLCLEANSQTWVGSRSSPIRSATYFNPLSETMMSGRPYRHIFLFQ